MEETEIISYQKWDYYARRLEGKNLREYGRSLSWASIASRANHYVIEIFPGKDDDHGTMRVRVGWRKAMKEAASEDTQAAIGGGK